MSAVGGLLLGPWHKVALQETSTLLNSDSSAETTVHFCSTSTANGIFTDEVHEYSAGENSLPEARAVGYCEDVAVPKIQETIAESVTVTPQEQMSPAPPALKDIGDDAVPVVSQVYQEISEVLLLQHVSPVPLANPACYLRSKSFRQIGKQTAADHKEHTCTQCQSQEHQAHENQSKDKKNHLRVGRSTNHLHYIVVTSSFGIFLGHTPLTVRTFCVDLPILCPPFLFSFSANKPLAVSDLAHASSCTWPATGPTSLDHRVACL